MTRLSPGGGNWITAPGSNPSSALSASRDWFPFHGEKINTHRCSAEGHRGVGGGGRTVPGRAGPGRGVLTSVLPQHPIAVRVDVPGASRTLTEPHGASRSFSSAAAGSAARQAGGRTRTAPRALPACTHCAAARSRRPSPERRRSRRSVLALRPAVHAIVGASSGYRTERGINGRGFVRHTSWWAVRCSGHSSHCACAISVRVGTENKRFYRSCRCSTGGDH